MNNRFKCRLWDKNNKVMHYEAEYITSGDSGNDWIIFKSDKQKLEENDIFKQPYFRQQFIIMQCTGLKDKNGKLIYEGDILGGIYENLDIFYCKECMQFELHANGYGCMCCNGDIHWCEVVEDNNKLEVIGNIYENKELLESR